MPVTELFGTQSCPYTQELRDWLDFKRCEFVEYDVEAEALALERMQSLTGGQRTVPVLVEDGKVVQIGWQGHGCVVGASNT
jgi:glutaredoxin 3